MSAINSPIRVWAEPQTPQGDQDNALAIEAISHNHRGPGFDLSSPQP